MSDIAIKAENISKAYQLGEFTTGTLSRDIQRRWALMRGKEDPYLKIGETNDRTSKGGSNIVWSLKDINFEINQGDAVGIIGRNGAGKSTLLKVLSRVTTPTTGNIKVKGRIASLLEVGTGFHPELTGRENIFLNGAILGMRKHEIKKHFDAIVDFAGVERYIDTPVKRYSSGMYVRLAFAVAAHLESEILIVDEVLAVGDAEFQKKCLGKMGDVSKGEGRTVLFVSHNMTAVKQLCNTGVVLSLGKIDFSGSAMSCITHYNSNQGGEIPLRNLSTIKHAFLNVEKVYINNRDKSPILLQDNTLEISIEGICTSEVEMNLEVKVYTNENVLVSFYGPGHMKNETFHFNKGAFTIVEKISFPQSIINGDYYAKVSLACPNVEVYYELEEIKLIKENFQTQIGRSLNYNEVGFFIMNQV